MFTSGAVYTQTYAVLKLGPILLISNCHFVTHVKIFTVSHVL